MDQQARRLIEAALGAREKAYAPHSGFAVGAALLGKSGRVHVGCNVENASYGATLCAERVALGRAVSEGERDFSAIAIVADVPEGCAPCGICRQALVEFGDGLRVIMANLQGGHKCAPLRDLLPAAFDRAALPARRQGGDGAER